MSRGLIVLVGDLTGDPDGNESGDLDQGIASYDYTDWVLGEFCMRTDASCYPPPNFQDIR